MHNSYVRMRSHSNHMHHNAYLDAVCGQLCVHPRLGPMDEEETRAVGLRLGPDEVLVRSLLSLEDEEDEVLTDQLLDELDAVIVSGGKTVDEIKAMHVLEKKKHAEVCNKNRSISAQSVNELATKMGCPSDYTTKLSKLGWIFLQLQA